MYKEFIGVDLGSNSLRAVRMSYDGEKFLALKEFDSTVRTAEGLEESGEISKEAVGRIVENLLKMRVCLSIVESDRVVALTTQAMRKAKNQKEVLEFIFKETGIAFQVIDGSTEARITALAPKIALKNLKKQNPKYNKDCFLLIDMGGASSEFIVCRECGDFIRSFEIGIVSAKERFRSIEELIRRKEEFLMPMREFLQECKEKGAIPQFILANSGTPTMVCAFKLGLKKYNPKSIFGMELTRKDFEVELQKFSLLSLEEQIAFVGKFKADVVPYGITLFTSFMECLGFKECLVIDEGLREGAVIAKVFGII